MKKYYVDIYPDKDATDPQCLAVERALERLVGDHWDETDEVGGRTRYRQGFGAEADAVGFAEDFKALQLRAELAVVVETVHAFEQRK